MDASLHSRAKQLADEFANQAASADDLNGLVRVMVKAALERMLNTEMDVHLGRRMLPVSAEAPVSATDSAGQASAGPSSSIKSKPNRRNGRSSKTVAGDLGEIDIDTPRDRHGTFEPQVIPKHQRRLAGFDQKIMALYAKGMTTRDIQEIVRELYDVDVSATLISEITATQARALMDDGTISGGMIPKVETCLAALNGHADGAVIIDGRVPHAILVELFTPGGAGTLIRPD